MIQIDREEAAELAAAILDMDPPESDAEIGKIEARLFIDMGLDMDDLAKYAEALLPLCASSQSSLTGRFFKGFARNGVYIVKAAYL